GPRGLFVDFFGRPASTHKAVALLAIEYRVPMVVLGVIRLPGDLRYRIVIEDVIDPAEYEDRPDAVRAITQQFTAGRERLGVDGGGEGRLGAVGAAGAEEVVVAAPPLEAPAQGRRGKEGGVKETAGRA